jgi:hypothetical protein
MTGGGSHHRQGGRATDARRRLIGIAATLAIGLAILQPPSGVAAEEAKLTEESDPPTNCVPVKGGACYIIRNLN